MSDKQKGLVSKVLLHFCFSPFVLVLFYGKTHISPLVLYFLQVWGGRWLRLNKNYSHEMFCY